MNNINFDISTHWLPKDEKQGSIEKDTLRVKISGINFHSKPEAKSWGVFTGIVKLEPNNSYDTNAIGFYKTDGQLLGFVQKELQDYVNKFSKGKELDCVIAITPFISKDGKVRNQAYATILKFFEDDVEYATEMINRITEDVGNDAFIEITHFEKSCQHSMCHSQKLMIRIIIMKIMIVMSYSDMMNFTNFHKAIKQERKLMIHSQ